MCLVRQDAQTWPTVAYPWNSLFIILQSCFFSASSPIIGNDLYRRVSKLLASPQQLTQNKRRRIKRKKMRVEREKKIRSDEKFHELFISKRFWLETRDVRCYVPKSPSLLSGLPGEQSRYPLLRLHMRMCMMELVSDNCLVTPINKYYLCICLQRIFPNYLQKNSSLL